MNRFKHIATIAAWAGLLLSLLLFLAISLYQLYLPGFYYDEALDLVPMLQLMHGESPELLRGIGIGGYPIMLLDYMGSWGGYATLPFMWLFGPGVVAARAQSIFFSAITIMLAWLWARRWFGDGVATLTALLLAVNPSFIWFSRQGISVSSTMTICSLGAMVLLAKLAKDNKNLISPPLTLHPLPFILLFAAGFLLGLGLWVKLLFFRWCVVMAVWLMGYWLTTRPKPSTNQLMQPLLMLGLGLLVGAAPLIYYNLAGWLRDGNAPTLMLLLNSLNNPTQQFGVDNRNVWGNLLKSWDDVRVFIDGSYFWYNGTPFSNIYAFSALLLAVPIGGALALWQKQARKFWALVAGILILMFLGAFTVSGLWSTHQFIMLPLPQMILAYATFTICDLRFAFLRQASNTSAKSKIANLALAALLLSPIIATDLWVNSQHHRVLSETGGTGRFSDAIYKLAEHLDQQKISQPIALDWGIEKQVQVLTADRVRPLEVFGYSAQADDGFRARARELLQDPTRRYIVLWDRFAVYNRRLEFTQLAQAMGKQVSETFIAHERSGLPVYVILKAE